MIGREEGVEMEKRRYWPYEVVAAGDDDVPKFVPGVPLSEASTSPSPSRSPYAVCWYTVSSP